MNLLQLNSNVEKLHFLQDYNVPAYNVFSFFSDHNRLSEVYSAIIRRLTDSNDPRNANGLGSSRIVIAFPTIFQETITKYIEPTLIEYKITFGSPLKNHIGIMHFIDLGNGKSRLDYTIEFEPRIPKTGFFLRNLLEKQVGAAIRELAHRFEKNPNY
ncbi:MAG: SRPBCC family protein [Saprospirales bacterium]|nr:SRPBCC family protein [Saprospirales bacterium]MBK8352862.1 SRPBCC family protein [Saprospirales bacterium]